MEEKKTIYIIECYGGYSFEKTLRVLLSHGFLYRHDRLTTSSDAVSRYGWASKLAIYADDCKKVILSVSGDEVDRSKFKTITLTLEEFIEHGLHKF